MSAPAARDWHLIAVSAADAAGLDETAGRLGAMLADHPQLSLGELTAALARRPVGPHRQAVVARSTVEIVEAMSGTGPGDGGGTAIRGVAADIGPVVFLYPGVGDHYPGMAGGLYRALPAFRIALDRYSAIARAEVGVDPVATVLAPTGSTTQLPADPLAAMLRPSDRAPELDEPRTAQVLMFAVELALTDVLHRSGVWPTAVLGYSLGEYAAATVAGVVPFDEAIRLVCRRAALFDHTPHGGMLAVLLGADELDPYLRRVGDPALAIAAVDGPTLCVASGPLAAVELLADELTADGVATRRLPVRHAFHSSLLAGIEEPLAAALSDVSLKPPQIPMLSNVTGGWLTDGEATDPAYWVRHTCGTVRFSEDLATMWALPSPVVIEVGPGRTLGTLALSHPDRTPHGLVLPTLPGHSEAGSDLAALLTAVGRAWVRGLPVDLGAVASL
jgi:acyl transferase domain-containing protein